MSSDIDSIRDFNPPSDGGGGKYLKFEDGDSTKVRLFSLPVIYQNLYKGPDGDKLSTQFAFVVWNFDASCAQIWQTNGATYAQQIKPLLNPVDDTDEADWRKFDVRITRTGVKAQTRYNIKAGTKVYDLERDEIDACNEIDIIALIDKSPNTSQVMWLTEWRELEAKGKLEDKKTIDKTVRDMSGHVQEDNLGDEPINLDDIPF